MEIHGLEHFPFGVRIKKWNGAIFERDLNFGTQSVCQGTCILIVVKISVTAIHSGVPVRLLHLPAANFMRGHARRQPYGNIPYCTH